MAINKTKDFFLGALDNQRDPVRTTRWRLLIPGNIFTASGLRPTNGDSFGRIEGEDDFAIHVKTAKIPEIKVDTKEIEYMGFKMNFPTNAEIGAELDFEAIMYEDMRAWEAVLAWEQSIINTGLLIDNTDSDRMGQTGLELGLGNHKVSTNPTAEVLRNNTIRLELYNWMTGDCIFRMNLINAMPTSVGGPSLNHKDADIARFNFKLKCDRWSVYIPEKYKTGKGAGTSAF